MNEPLVAGVNCARPIDVRDLREADRAAQDAREEGDLLELRCEELEVQLGELWAECARARLVALQFWCAAEKLRAEFQAERRASIDSDQATYEAEMTTKEML